MSSDDGTQISDEEMESIIKTIKTSTLEEAAIDAGIELGKWSKRLIALHIFHSVGTHMEKRGVSKGIGQLDQMRIVNDAISDITGLNEQEIAKLATESLQYSELIDKWLVKNGHAENAL